MNPFKGLMSEAAERYYWAEDDWRWGKTSTTPVGFWLLAFFGRFIGSNGVHERAADGWRRPPIKAALALSLAILATTPAAGSFSCSRMGSITSCSDGSHIERMGSQTFIRKRDAAGILRSTRCEKMGSMTRCR